MLSQTQDPVPGDSLDLTIDLKTQQQAQTALEWGLKTAHVKSGVVIAMDPQTGQILAMVSLPTYDDNAFAQGISDAQFQAYLKDPEPAAPEPRHRRAVRPWLDLQADHRHRRPGRQEDHRADADPHRRRTCASGPTSTPTGTTWASGTSTSTTASATRATRSSTRWQACWEPIASATGPRSTASGSPTGVDLPGEAAGIVPTNAWKQEVFGQNVFPGEVYQAGIGQGYDAVTPLQLINAYAALANGGKLYQPQVVQQIVGPDGQVVAAVRAQAHPHARGEPAGAAGDAGRGALPAAPAPHLQPGGRADRHRREVRHVRVRRPRCPGSPAVQLVVRGLRAQGCRPRRRATRTASRRSRGPTRTWS